jgi:pyridoxine 5-phosphate synthase
LSARKHHVVPSPAKLPNTADPAPARDQAAKTAVRLQLADVESGLSAWGCAMRVHIRLGVNVDHIATLRNARGGFWPDPVEAAQLAVLAGADSITVHLREDRRHIRDDDVMRIRDAIAAPLNLEIAATPEMIDLASRFRPDVVCLVPERRQERTTEGGLEAAALRAELKPLIARLADASIPTTLFIEPKEQHVLAARDVGAAHVELHTGRYSDCPQEKRARELTRLAEAARVAGECGVECHAGHGLNYNNVGPVAAIPEVVELNIGHFIVAEAVMFGLRHAISRMRRCCDNSRKARA